LLSAPAAASVSVCRRRSCLPPPLPPLLSAGGMTICHTNEFVQSHFSDGNLIARYINKMATNGGGGVVDGMALRRL
jgi:hypothetical protein